MSRMNYRQSSESPPPSPGLRGFLEDRPQLPYLIPFMGFVALMLPATFGDFAGIDWKTLWHHWHPFIYAAKTLVAALLLWAFWKSYTRIRWTHLHWGLLAGLLGTPLWIATEFAYQHLCHSQPFDPLNYANYYNPYHELQHTWAQWAYLIIRIAGPTLVVPVMEELFFRDFLMRALIRGERFQDVAIGQFTWFSFIGMSLFFGINHGAEWPEGILYGMLMGLLLIRTKSLGACIVAHGTTNLTLYLYVIVKGGVYWQFM